MTKPLLRTLLTAVSCLAFAGPLAAQNASPAPPPLPAPAPAPAPASTPSRATTRPNILVIVADDLGYSDIGAFGGEIRTPNLDALARGGVRLTGFHGAPTCSPTRSMLLSGTDNHLAGLGNMAEMRTPNQIGRPGYQGYLPGNVVTVAERLRALGYTTMMSGKWHLGVRPEDSPARHGFDQSFDLAQGGGNHYGADLSHAPGDHGTTYWENGRQLATLPPDFYSSDSYATKLIEQLGRADSSRPFFAYLTFTAPHWPLQAPAEDIARYRGRYDAGFEALRGERLQRMQQLGLLPEGTVPHELVLPPGQRWADLTPEQRQRQSRLMEIYAAMVDRMDQNVGRVIAYLRETNQLGNTVILFTADNGADLARAEIPGVSERIRTADNSLANLGRATSYGWYGPGWAQAATAPSWMYKGFTTEGGTRVAAFVDWPGSARRGVSDAYGTVMDVLPTLVDAAGGDWHGGTFDGRAVQPVRGQSWAPFLAGVAEQVHSPDEIVGSELFGRRAVRQGDWKAVNLDGTWHLFNIRLDPGETDDRAAAEPERIRALARAWDRYAHEVGVVMPSVPSRYP